MGGSNIAEASTN